jgi:hypothetical protein
MRNRWGNGALTTRVLRRFRCNLATCNVKRPSEGWPSPV